MVVLVEVCICLLFQSPDFQELLGEKSLVPALLRKCHWQGLEEVCRKHGLPLPETQEAASPWD